MFSIPLRRSHLYPCLAALFCVLLCLRIVRSPSRSSTAPESPDIPLSETSPTSKYAIATLLTENAIQDIEGVSEDNDDYYVAARVLTYQLLRAPETRCRRSIPFVILVTAAVSQRKQQQLSWDGATVVAVKDVPLRWWIKTGVTRWKDVFTKLRVFELVEFDRILFLDLDTLITAPVDGIFDEPAARVPSETLLNRTAQIKADENPLPARYVFGARSNNEFSGKRDHLFPPPPTETFSSGFWLIAPSIEMYVYLLSVMGNYRRFDPHTMEQSLLNYAFRRQGTMPWVELHYQWSATWPNVMDVEEKVVTLHEKFWNTGPVELQRLWWDIKIRMEESRPTLRE